MSAVANRASGVLVRDVLVGVIGHQQRRRNTDDGGHGDVASDGVARSGPGEQVAISGAGPPPVMAARWKPIDVRLERSRGVKHSANSAACGPKIKPCGTNDSMTA